MTSDAPLVSCLMPTRDRRAFVPRAVRTFLAQTYPSRELLVLDDGDDPVGDLIPDDPRIRYVRLGAPLVTGAKRNRACALARGDLLAHWDDDDWSAPWRLDYQVERLLASDADLCGLRRLYYLDAARRQAWTYVYPEAGRPWAAGGTLLFRRAFWERHPFPEIQVASDTRFVWDGAPEILVLDDPSYYVATIHPANTSPKRTASARWRRLDLGTVRDLLGDDWAAFAHPEAASHPASGTAPATAETIPEAKVAPKAAPAVAILMVTHNALDVVRIAVLRTLRHSAAADARLVVVDNGSTDGTREWLRLLAARGDLDLIEADGNLGHGPALELARAQTTSPTLVTLDSDAFPLVDDWLDRLRRRLDDGAAVAGILHHRGYVHPSCLMIERATLDRYGLTFLNEKDWQSRLDVAERISVDLAARGLRLGGLERTGALRRGSRSEPVYLGSEYEGTVYHQWYTTRHVEAAGRAVDDVPPEAAAQSLRDLIEGYHTEPRDVTAVVGVRAGPEAPARRRNALAVLRALAVQDLERWRYRVVVVEQDTEPRLREAVAPLADRYVFAPHGGPYNRAWGFNVGVVAASHVADAVCCLDADLLVPADFLRRGLEALADAEALLPYREVVYLTEAATARALADIEAGALAAFDDARYAGRVFTSSQGGALWTTGALYREAGGHDERFEGWGREDREIHDRLSRHTPIGRLPLRLLHLHHPPAPTADAAARANRDLYARIGHRPSPTPTEIGCLDRYARLGTSDNAPAEPPSPEAARPEVGRRDWEHWHRWSPARLDRIVCDERTRAARQSHRRRLGERIADLGDSVLDVGCGPGALWTHLDRRRTEVTGLDASPNMVAAARRHFPDVAVVHGDAAALPFEDDAVDVVLLRHVAEHLPNDLLADAISEAARVARRAIVLDHYLPPLHDGDPEAARVGGGFWEIRRPEATFLHHLGEVGWAVTERSTWRSASGERDEVWVARPAAHALPSVPMRTDLLVNIVLPTYRRAHTLGRTVRQVLAQSYPTWELIVVDNGGDVDAAAFDDPRVQVVRHTARASASYARNRGLRHATGDLVCFFDDDDDMFEGYLARFVAAFEARPEARMVRAGMVVSDGTVNFTYATPEVCLRRVDAPPRWEGRGAGQDQRYFRSLVARGGWSEANGQIVCVPEAVCRANTDPRGGLRAGRH